MFNASYKTWRCFGTSVRQSARSSSQHVTMPRQPPVATAAASAAHTAAKKLQETSGVRCGFGRSSFGHLAGRSAEERDFAREHEHYREKCCEEFADIIEKKDGYKKFYEQFGKFLTFAIHENSTNQREIAESVRFSIPSLVTS